MFMPSDASEAKREPGLGAVIWDEPNPDGGVFGMDLRRMSRAYHERHVALSGNGVAGTPALVAMLDLMDDHLTRAWTWRITYEPGLDLHIDADVPDSCCWQLMVCERTGAFSDNGPMPSAASRRLRRVAPSPTVSRPVILRDPWWPSILPIDPFALSLRSWQSGVRKHRPSVWDKASIS